MSEEEKKKKAKKVKVEYDVDIEADRAKKAKKAMKASSKGSLSKGNFVGMFSFLIFNVLIYYFITPPINIHVAGFWVWLAFIFGGLGLCSLKPTLTADKKSFDLASNNKKVSKTFGILTGIIVALLIVGGISSSKLFNASRYAGIIQVTPGDFNVDIPESENISNIALMDTDSARIIGSRAIGSLSDVVSQFEVSSSYSTIDYNGAPMKVAALEYAGFFKYMNNKEAGIPGYVLVDPVKNDAKYVELSKPMKYTPSGFFNHNLMRHVQFKYPTYDYEGYYLELDNEGNPFYICPVLKPNAGLFGAKDVKGVVICDPCTGDCDYYTVGNVPNWVDRVYDGDLACRKYDWYGKLSGGFWNSLIGNKGCKVTTEDYGYLVMDGDVWVYTGVTSVNGDESNIGFVLMNSRTAESKYFSIAGAEEFSAMSSAEGQVQNLGYNASFPSLINISGTPTYIMVLKDNAGLVKMYALVNVENYSVVATGQTQREALSSYKKLLSSNGIVTSTTDISEDLPKEKAKISDIKYILVENETVVYITTETGNVYKESFANDETLIFLQIGDTATFYYNETENGIRELIAFE